MRRIGIVIAFAAVVMFGFGVLADAQQGGKKGKGGKGFGGGFGMFGQMNKGNDPLALLNMADVKKELDLSVEQTEKLPSAVMGAIGKVLNDKQMKRFRQIHLQVRGTQALAKDKDVQDELKLTTSQVKNIGEIMADTQKEVSEIQKEAMESKSFQGVGEKIQGVQKESKEKIMGVLNADQKTKYKDMLGDTFKFETKGRFGGKKKNDA